MNGTTAVDDEAAIAGWTSSPNGRGTLDILFSCAITFVLCSWSCICCNIPAPGTSFARQLGRKIQLTVISAIGPEFVLYIALTQWIHARKSVLAFHKLGYHQWTMKQAFYADMGGFRLRPTDYDDAFPLNTKSLLWLIEEGFLPEQQIKDVVLIETEVIEDRNKTDAVVRIITLFQTLWFMINVVARLCMGFPTSALELTVLGYLAPYVITYWLWWYKPRDIESSTTINLSVSIADVQERAGPEAYSWYLSPFDFVERHENHGNLLYTYWRNILKHIYCIVLRKPHRFRSRRREKRPRQYRSDNQVLEFDEPNKYGAIEVFPTMFYLGIPYVAWNWHFPTSIERILWRYACIMMSAPYLLGALWEFAMVNVRSEESERARLARYRQDAAKCRRELQGESGLKVTGLSWPRHLSVRFKLLCQWLRNNSFDNDPNLDVPLRMLIPATIATLVYLFSRSYMLAEDLAGLRAMPVGVYQSIDWTEVLPHFS